MSKVVPLHDSAVEIAQKTLGKAYAPYSGYRVSAVLEDENGRLYPGCNIENASFGATICAKSAALCNLLVSGGKTVKNVWVVVDDDRPATPCGICRQRLKEFATPDCTVTSMTVSGIANAYRLTDLLPHSFSLDNRRQIAKKDINRAPTTGVKKGDER